jgi:quercetin dioxygenase-like cupin family protein
MRKEILALAVFVLLFKPLIVGASGEIDPTVVSPEIFEVLLENEYVRVIQYELDPGERDDWHTHPAKVSVVTAGGMLRITTSEGESFQVTEESGAASWMEALQKHYAENIGETTVRIILVEVKSASVDSPEQGE